MDETSTDDEHDLIDVGKLRLGVQLTLFKFWNSLSNRRLNEYILRVCKKIIVD